MGAGVPAVENGGGAAGVPASDSTCAWCGPLVTRFAGWVGGAAMSAADRDGTARPRVGGQRRRQPARPVVWRALAPHRVMVLIRRERPDDHRAVRAVVAAAFGAPDVPGRTPAEADLVDQLRADPAWIPALSLVAAAPDGRLVGHVLASRAHVGATPALALAPLSVLPSHQRQGVGAALTHAVLGAADALDEPLVALLGDPAYYRRFGFRPSAEYHITAPVSDWQPHFQVRALTAHRPAIRGVFTYSAPFDRL